MARLKRLVVVGAAHHVVLKGSVAGAVFAAHEDYAGYLGFLAPYARKLDVDVHAFALLPNQVHLLATPRAEGALSKLMQALGRGFTADFNRRYRRAGPLWAGRFQAVPVEAGSALVDRMRFIEQLPIRAGLVDTAADYAWSSAVHHIGASPLGWLVDHVSFWELGNTPFDRQQAYATHLAVALSDLQFCCIEQSASKGWMTGSARFMDSIAQKAGRRVRPLASGRPKKSEQLPRL